MKLLLSCNCDFVKDPSICMLLLLSCGVISRHRNQSADDEKEVATTEPNRTGVRRVTSISRGVPPQLSENIEMAQTEEVITGIANPIHDDTMI